MHNFSQYSLFSMLSSSIFHLFYLSFCLVSLSFASSILSSCLFHLFSSPLHAGHSSLLSYSSPFIYLLSSLVYHLYLSSFLFHMLSSLVFLPILLSSHVISFPPSPPPLANDSTIFSSTTTTSFSFSSYHPHLHFHNHKLLLHPSGLSLTVLSIDRLRKTETPVDRQTSEQRQGRQTGSYKDE